MCAEKSVDVAIHFRKRLGAGFFGGEGFIMQKLTGPGLVFVELDGEIVEQTLAPNQTLLVDTGYVAMYEPSVDFDIEMVRGIKNVFFGGEGLFLARLRGPGRVWLQTMPMYNLARKVATFVHRDSGSSSTGGNIAGEVVKAYVTLNPGYEPSEELERELRRLDRFQVVILDDIGYVQQSREEMEVLFTFLAERYERRSVVITSNLVFSEW